MFSLHQLIRLLFCT